MDIKKEVIFYEKGYRVDEEGVARSRRGIIGGSLNKNGYRYIFTTYKGKVIVIAIHRLVAYQKFGDLLFKKGIVVRHLDGDKLNNSFDNIEIGTHSQNMMDIPEEVRIRKSKYASTFVKKYSYKEIYELRALGKKYSEISKLTGASHRVITIACREYVKITGLPEVVGERKSGRLIGGMTKMNHKARKSSSGYRGVCWNKKNKKWVASVSYKGKSYYLGYFINKEDAAKAHDIKALELHGNFAQLNFPNILPTPH